MHLPLGWHIPFIYTLLLGFLCKMQQFFAKWKDKKKPFLHIQQLYTKELDLVFVCLVWVYSWWWYCRIFSRREWLYAFANHMERVAVGIFGFRKDLYIYCCCPLVCLLLVSPDTGVLTGCFQYTIHVVYKCMNEETGYRGFALSTVSYTGTGAGVCVLCECPSFDSILISYSGLFSML